MKKAVGYIRVSTISQVFDKGSLSNQRKRVEAHCVANDWELIKVYEDAGISGAKDNRPGLQALLQSGANHEFDTVIVRDLSWFGRSARDLLNNVNTLQLHNVDFVSIKENIDISTSVGRLFLNILASISEFERELIQDRMVESRNVRWKDRKIFVGKPPFGYRWSKEEHEVIIYPDEVQTYRRIVSDYLDLKKSTVSVAIDLERDHVPTRHKGKRWTTVVILQILRHPAYWSGKIVVNQTRPQEEHITFHCEPLVSKSRWDAIQQRLDNSKLTSGRPSKAADAFMLHGLLRCGYCGAKLSTQYGSRIRADGRWTWQYMCIWHELQLRRVKERGRERCPLPRINAEDIEKIVWARLGFILIDEPGETLDTALDAAKWERKINVVEQKIAHLKLQKKQAEKALVRLDDLLRSDTFDLSTYATKRNAFLLEVKQFELETMEAVQELEVLRRMQADESLLRQFGRDRAEALSQVVELLNNLSVPKKRRLLEGLLAHPITVGPVPEGEFYLVGDTPKEPEVIGDESDVDECLNAEDLVPDTPIKLTAIDVLDISFRYNPEIIQEILGSAIRSIDKNSKFDENKAR